jgi:hypothetical protein
MFAVALCQEMLELYEMQHALWTVMLPAIFPFILTKNCYIQSRSFFFSFSLQSAVFIFVSQLTLLVPLVVSDKLIRKVAEV